MQFYGFAADQLPYETKDGGYLAPHWDTYDLFIRPTRTRAAARLEAPASLHASEPDKRTGLVCI